MKGWLVLINLLLLFCAVGNATGDERETNSEKEQRAAWTKYYAKQLENYEIHFGKDPAKQLEVDPKARFRWGNPIRVGNTHGDLFVWTYKGRVELVGTIFSYEVAGEQRRVAHGFHSMSTEPVTIRRQGRPSFTIDGPGVDFEVIPEAPTPAKSRGLRMAQMRRLAKSFSASLRDGQVERPLHPLNEPLFRFETNRVEDDGAVFAYVMGTDPELIVAIVAKATPDGAKWHFAAGRFASKPLKLSYQRKTVWAYGDGVAKDDGYVSQHGIDQQPKSLLDKI